MNVLEVNGFNLFLKIAFWQPSEWILPNHLILMVIHTFVGPASKWLAKQVRMSSANSCLV